MMKKIAILMLVLASFIACSDDDTASSQQAVVVSDLDLLKGEWVSPNSSLTYYTDLVMEGSQKAAYYVIQNEVGAKAIADQDEGSWHFYPDRQTISFYVSSHSISGLRVTSFDGDKMSLHNLDYNTDDVFYRVVESIEIGAGQTYAISYMTNRVDSSSTTYTSSNEDIAIVGSDGIVRGVQEGICFISLENGDDRVYAKVSVKGRITRYAEETHMLIDDIFKRYGEPGLSMAYNDTQMGIQYLNPIIDDNLYALQYRYHKDTHEIYLIQTIYQDPNPFLVDWTYIDNYFYHQEDISGFTYTETERYWDNSYTVTCIIDNTNGLYWINYKNQDYID